MALNCGAGLVCVFVIGHSHSTQSLAHSTKSPNTDITKLLEEGYIVGEISIGEWTNLRRCIVGAIGRADVTGSLFNGDPVPEKGEEQKGREHPETGRYISGEDDHLTPNLTERIRDAVVASLTAMGEAADIDVEWLKNLIVDRMTTYIVKCIQGHAESQMVHVDYIPVFVERMGRGTEKEPNTNEVQWTQFTIGPFSLILPLSPRIVGVVPGGHRKFRFNTKKLLGADGAIDGLQMSSSVEVEQEIAKLHSSTGMTEYVKWEKIISLIAANYTYEGDLSYLPIPLATRRFLFFITALPHLGMGNFTKNDLDMIFMLFQQKGTPVITLPKTILATECMDSLRCTVRCSHKCATCKQMIMMTDYHTGPGGDNICSTCFPKMQFEWAVRKKYQKDVYAPSSRSEFDQAFQGATTLVQHLVGMRIEDDDATVGMFGAMCVKQHKDGDVHRFVCDLASWVVYASRVKFKTTNKCFGRGRQLKVVKNEILLVKLQNAFVGMRAKIEAEPSAWSSVVVQVMARMGQGVPLAPGA
jgi:hypothetical protein